jgi:DNA-binding GntR family transcriptional regulator
VERLRLADDVPMALERAVLAPDLAPVLDEDLGVVSLHAAMERLGRTPTRAAGRAGPRPRPPAPRAVPSCG